MIQGKKIFITGGTGFIGTAMCEKLLESNQVTVYDINRKGRNTMQSSHIKDHPNLTKLEGDILDKEKLKQALSPGYDLVFHLAAIAGVSSYYTEAEKTIKVNLLGTLNLLDALAENPVKPELVVDFSTSEVYGNQAFNAKETQDPSVFVPTDDRGSYCISKVASERLLFIYSKKFGFKSLAVRPFNVYGPGQVGEGAIANFIQKALLNEPIQITGDGTPVRAWCYITDFLEGLFAAVEKRDTYESEILNIGNPYEIETTLGLAKNIIQMIGSTSPLNLVPHIGTEIQVRIPDVSKINNMFNFFPKVSLGEGIKKTIEWWKKINSPHGFSL